MLLVPATDTDCDSILQVLVCSDSMTRGVDIDGVQCIINYHPPAHYRTYQHRVGRTARAGQEGVAYTLLVPDQVSTSNAYLTCLVMILPIQVSRFSKMLQSVGREKMKKEKVTEEQLQCYQEQYEAALSAVKESVAKQEQ